MWQLRLDGSLGVAVHVRTKATSWESHDGIDMTSDYQQAYAPWHCTGITQALNRH